MKTLVKIICVTHLCVALLYSCSPEKRLQRKKEEAVAVVLADNKLVDRVGEVFLKNHNPDNDLIFDVDSVPLLPKYAGSFDTTNSKKIIDSLMELWKLKGITVYDEGFARDPDFQRYPNLVNWPTNAVPVSRKEIDAAYTRGYNEAYNQAGKIQVLNLSDPDALIKAKAELNFYKDGYRIKSDSLYATYQWKVDMENNLNNFWYTVKASGRNLIKSWQFWALVAVASGILVFKNRITTLFQFKRK